MAKQNIVAGLDVGSGQIKMLVVQENSKEDKIQILSQTREISSGVKKGVVMEAEEASDAIASCLDKAEIELGRKINKVFININGSHIFSTFSKGLVSVSRADQKISKGDIDRVLQAAETLSLPSNKEILDVFPKEFIVDGERGIKEPVGMQGVRLEADVVVVGCLSPFLNNLNQAVLNAGLHIQDSMISPVAASVAVLNKKEKELGVALLDIGAWTTGLAVFEEGSLSHVAVFPFGASSITNDIAIFLKTDIDTAERIKLEFGSCVIGGADKKEKIQDEISGETIVFSRKKLAKVINDRVSEIFDQVNKELKKISRQEALPSGIVITGGGAQLPKLTDIAKKELKLSCRIGYPEGFIPAINDPSLSVVCGLVLSELGGEDNVLKDSAILDKIKKVLKVFVP